MSGILTISPAHNSNFSRLLSYYGIVTGTTNPMWGINNKNYSYYACAGYPDQINLYRLHRAVIGGLSSPAITYGDIGDNSGTLRMPFKYHHDSLWSIPDFIENDFEQCIAAAVAYYSSIHDHCSILYSGGVDSTCIVAAFIKYSHKDKFTVAYTGESIVEYPLFFDYLIRNNINLINLETTELDDLPGIIFHGSSGDSLLPSVDKFSKLGNLAESWPAAFDEEEWGNDLVSLVEFTESLLPLFGKTNPTVADLCVFTKFITRYNYSFSHYHVGKNLPKEKMSSFFKFDAFNRWSYHHGNAALLGSHVPHLYRKPMKDVIFSVTHDPDYVNTKLKGNSRHLWQLKCNIPAGAPDSAIDYFFVDYTGEKISAATYDEFRHKYNDRFDSYFTSL